MNSLWAASRMRRVTMAGSRATMSCAGPRFRVSVPMGFVNKAREVGKHMAGYVRNVWYMAAWESEIEDSELLTRTLLDEPRLVLRKSDRSGYALLDDRCPHRFAPLSMGKRNGDLISCGYHGLTFDTSGRCVRNPFSPTIPPRAAVCTFPVIARHSIV